VPYECSVVPVVAHTGQSAQLIFDGNDRDAQFSSSRIEIQCWHTPVAAQTELAISALTHRQVDSFGPLSYPQRLTNDRSPHCDSLGILHFCDKERIAAGRVIDTRAFQTRLMLRRGWSVVDVTRAL
jgi:hypothetical protein